MKIFGLPPLDQFQGVKPEDRLPPSEVVYREPAVEDKPEYQLSEEVIDDNVTR